jgi:hypothetical protein
MPKMTLEQLRVFIAVAELQHMREPRRRKLGSGGALRAMLPLGPATRKTQTPPRGKETPVGL